MKQIWHLIGRSGGTYLFIAHWELFISLSLMYAWLLCSFETLTCWLYWLRVPIVAIFPMLHCYICLGHWRVDYIDWSSCLSYHSHSVFVMFVLITSHTWIHCCMFFDLMCWFSGLYIVLIIFEHAVFVIIRLDCLLSMLSLSLFILIVIACIWTWMVYLCFAWLYVAWLLFFCMIAWRLSVWAAHISPYLKPSSFLSFLSS